MYFICERTSPEKGNRGVKCVDDQSEGNKKNIHRMSFSYFIVKFGAKYNNKPFDVFIFFQQKSVVVVKNRFDTFFPLFYYYIMLYNKKRQKKLYKYEKIIKK